MIGTWRGKTTPDGGKRPIDVARRAIDLTIGLLLGVIVIPVIALAALVSAATLRAWPFFVQERVGDGGRPFRFVKIRTLPRSTPTDVDKHQLDLSLAPRLCVLLRRLHLDELPQLFLVVAGRMTLVGPRPEMVHLHERLPEDFATLRTSVPPGCTGLWQVSRACTDLIGNAPEYDRFYLANRTLRLDLWVLYRTARKMLGIGGGVSLHDVPDWAVRRTEPIDLRVSVEPHLDPVLVEPKVQVTAAAGR